MPEKMRKEAQKLALMIIKDEELMK